MVKLRQLLVIEMVMLFWLSEMLRKKKGFWLLKAVLVVRYDELNLVFVMVCVDE